MNDTNHPETGDQSDLTKPQVVAEEAEGRTTCPTLLLYRAALETASVAFEMLDPANHGQTSDGELANLITTASKAVSDALKEGT